MTLTQQKKNGYRLPTAKEWELAARWRGTTAPKQGTITKERIATREGKTTYYWTPGNYVSGEDGDDAYAFGVVESEECEPCENQTFTKTAQLKPNALGLYDMSGNAGEWLFVNAQKEILFRTHYVGSLLFESQTDRSLLGEFEVWQESEYRPGGYRPEFEPFMGFRIARSAMP